MNFSRPPPPPPPPTLATLYNLPKQYEAKVQMPEPREMFLNETATGDVKIGLMYFALYYYQETI